MYCKYLDINNDKEFQILAKTLDSLDKAYILAKIDGWVQHNEKHEKKESFVAGRYWLFATVNQLYNEMFSFYGCEKTLQRHLKSLERDGYLIRERHNKIKSQRLWYRVDRAKVMTACEMKKLEMQGLLTVKNRPESVENEYEPWEAPKGHFVPQTFSKGTFCPQTTPFEGHFVPS